VPDPTTEGRELSTAEFEVVWESLGLGHTPVVLDLPSPGRTHTERRRLVADAWAAMRHRGLVGAAGPEPGLARLLRRLAAPAARIELRASGTVRLRAVAAGDAEDGVLVRRQGSTVTVQPCTSLPAAIVGALPPAVAGPGRSVVVPDRALIAALQHPFTASDLLSRGVRQDDAAPAALMLQRIDGCAQFGVVVADRWGFLRRSPAVIGTLDGPRGRYLATPNGGWMTITPTDGRRLRHRVGDLLDRAVEQPDQSRSPWRMSCRPLSVIEPDRDG
jgi:hypothetical protein